MRLNTKKAFSTKRTSYVFVFVFFMSCALVFSQEKSRPSAKFTFNNGTEIDEITKQSAKLVGAYHTDDRFGNDKHAVRILGDPFSYINLGTSKVLKQNSASISFWVLLEDKIWTGQGIRVNPLLLTKSHANDDFFEAYSIYYELDSQTLRSNLSQDSVRQAVTSSLSKFSLNKWHHIVLTYDYKYTAMYIDGKLQRNAIKNFETTFLASDSVLLGSMGNKKNKRFTKAAFDDIEFYDSVLSESEIKRLFEAPNPNRFKVAIDWVLFGLAFVAVIVIIYFVVRYRLSITLKKEKQRLELLNMVLKTELRVNRALMNPHFVFNSLNVLQNFILKNENERANSYLIKFSKLVRKILESNMSDSITLEFEIQLLKSYLEIENLRFEENIVYKISHDANIIPSSIKIPILMLQPFVENAIWHGLLNKQGEKLINVSFSIFEHNYILCTIEDNGTGRKTDDKAESKKPSLATTFINQRLNLINRIYDLKCTLQIEDKPNNGGTIVRILLPIIKT